MMKTAHDQDHIRLFRHDWPCGFVDYYEDDQAVIVPPAGRPWVADVRLDVLLASGWFERTEVAHEGRRGEHC